MWRTFVYCMACDKRIRLTDTRCPHCGVTFGKD